MPAVGPDGSAMPVAMGRLRASAFVHAARRGGTTVLLDLGSGTYFTLNVVAGRIWELLALGSSAEAIVAQLKAEYDTPVATLAADTAALLERLLELKLIAPAPPE